MENQLVSSKTHDDSCDDFPLAQTFSFIPLSAFFSWLVFTGIKNLNFGIDSIFYLVQQRNGLINCYIL